MSSENKSTVRRERISKITLRLYSRIWELADRPMRRDAVLTKLDCSPRLYDAAMEYRKQVQDAAHALSSTESQPVVEEIPEIPNTKTSTAAPELSDSVDQCPPPSDTETTVENGTDSLLVRKVWRRTRRTPKARRHNAVPAITTRHATPKELAEKKSMIDLVIYNANIEFVGRSGTPLPRDGPTDRTYREAILLVLASLDIRPELAATALGLSEEAARNAFIHARAQVLASALLDPTLHATTLLSERLGIRLDRLKKRL